MLDKVVNPLVQKILGTVIRAALLTSVPILEKMGIWTADEGTTLVTQVATILAALAWSIYEKQLSLKEKNTAAAMAGATMKEVKANVAQGEAPPASLPNDVAPLLMSDYNSINKP